jgi:tryptophan halogenase
MLDTETFAFFNYQYILYGMGYRTDMSAARADFTQADEAERLFAKIRRFGERALADLPDHGALIRQINAVAGR